jgi:non-ribosomal peptide synthetase-like protein
VLGADSMTMTRFCARVRKRADLPTVSIKDVYQFPTVRALAAALAATAEAPGSASNIVDPSEKAVESANADRERVSGFSYFVCGFLQLLTFLGYACLAALLVARGYDWSSGGRSVAGLYLRAVAVSVVAVVGVGILPVLVKWVVVGRYKPVRIRVWSGAYFRFWLVNTMVRANPLVRLFPASPLYVWYLRALGARIGRNVTILSQHVPVCADLLTIGDNTVIRKDSFFTCYRAEGGVIQTGPVTLGRDAYVGEWSVLDIDTSMGDDTQLGHASSLYSGQVVPEGQRWHGSPARPTETNYRVVESRTGGGWRRSVYTVGRLVMVLGVILPVPIVGGNLLFARVPRLNALLGSGLSALHSGVFYVNAAIVSSALFFGGSLLGLTVALTVPRVLNVFLTADTVYPLYGFHYRVHRAVLALTNLKFWKNLLGDSSAMPHYLGWLGYSVRPLVQTGSNFSTGVKHDVPYLTRAGTGTVVADGLSVLNADFSHNSFRLSEVHLGSDSFLGNLIAYPAQARTGDNCLIATKAMVPIDGETRRNVGLLGSPCFEIPRTVQRDGAFIHLATGDELRRRLPAKNRHNANTMLLYIVERWVYYVAVTLIGLAMVSLYRSFGMAEVAAGNVVMVLFSILYSVFIERASLGFGSQRPRYCSIYERTFWRHERFWKMTLSASTYIPLLNGTPFKSAVWRMLGARVGKRLFDDGGGMVEKTLVTIGDDCTLNLGSRIQCHSQEDFAFKSDYVVVGSRCSIGVGALVHYGTVVGDGATIRADSFLMKGEEVPPRTCWGGNPAVQIAEASSVIGERVAPSARTPSFEENGVPRGIGC